jgi:hypothetical protein
MILGTVTPRENLENGVYEAIRKHLVSIGRLPNIVIHNTEDSFNVALGILRASLALEGKQIINVVNVQTTEGRDDMQLNTFYINYKSKGKSGAVPNKITLEEKTAANVPRYAKLYRRVRITAPEDLAYEVRYMTDSNENDKLMEQGLGIAIGECNYIEAFNNAGTAQGTFLIRFNGLIDMSTGRYFDRIARYVIKDSIIYEPVVVQDDIKPATIQAEVAQVTTFPPEL